MCHIHQESIVMITNNSLVVNHGKYWPQHYVLSLTCVSASVFDISKENISDPAIIAKGVSSPKAFAIPIAIAVFPVPGWPASRTALPAIFPSLIICRITPAACNRENHNLSVCMNILEHESNSLRQNESSLTMKHWKLKFGQNTCKICTVRIWYNETKDNKDSFLNQDGLVLYTSSTVHA